MPVTGPVIYVDQLFNQSGAAVTALTAMNTGTTAAAGTYAPQLSGTLIKIGIIVAPQAASSLCQAGRVEISQSSNWKPNLLRFPHAGFGLQTVPTAGPGGNVNITEFVVNQPVQTDWAITGNAIQFWSPVTPAIYVYGYFSAA